MIAQTWRLRLLRTGEQEAYFRSYLSLFAAEDKMVILTVNYNHPLASRTCIVYNCMSMSGILDTCHTHLNNMHAHMHASVYNLGIWTVTIVERVIIVFVVSIYTYRIMAKLLNTCICTFPYHNSGKTFVHAHLHIHIMHTFSCDAHYSTCLAARRNMHVTFACQSRFSKFILC